MAGPKGGREHNSSGTAGSASLVVRGGQVFDPVGGRFTHLDILAADGKVARHFAGAPPVSGILGCPAREAT